MKAPLGRDNAVGAADSPAELSTHHDEPRQWAVRVPKANGTQILFGRYDRQHEAEGIAAALRAVGCPATVSGGPRGTP